ncbi:MAG: hypothetical protein LBS56_02010 [Propionibacteriaceae bacterium]|nr:hypothetical protein [Propionibacteriaceae bacterium]
MGLFDWLKGGGDDTPSVAVTPPAPTPADITAALDRIRHDADDPSLPWAVKARVRRVAQRLADIVPRMDTAGLASVDQYSLIATATSYLPEALGNYARLPRDWANSRPIEGRKTALLILVDQLDLLGLTVDQMYDAVLQRDADALIAHGRFLQEKFAPGRTDAPPAAPPAPARSANPLDLE